MTEPQDDVTLEETEAPTAEEAVEASAPEADLLAERTADLQRVTAEYANYRRRVERDRQAVVDAAKASVVMDLLVVLDDLDRARTHGDLETGPLKSVADKLVVALTKVGLQSFGTEGDPFEPALHEAVQHEGDGSNPVVGLVMRKGYRLGERVLRHALVGVVDAEPEVPAEAEDSADN
ncbi:nucleotide exchange factor GrpE [Smaragdicoccus niigatensis]|uniref:nucleotide exchange factor GrpE n=1 Tax=Smaragdicoccus niigatensis TaxID=359359 RepID=UPI000377EA2D|nr:nucleotide exchange factor GrpE [Smaragdicoccus niigatensis]